MKILLMKNGKCSTIVITGKYKAYENKRRIRETGKRRADLNGDAIAIRLRRVVQCVTAISQTSGGCEECGQINRVVY